MSIINKLHSLKKHPGVSRYLKNTSWLICERLLRMVVGIFVGIWVARYLGPEQFGHFNYAISFVALFSAFSALGLDSIIVRELVNCEKKKNKLLGTAFTLKLVAAILVFILIIFSLFISSSENDTSVLALLIASATLFQSFNVIDFYFQSKVLSKFVVYCNTVGLLLSSLLKVVLILNEAPLVAFALVISFDSLILALGLIYFYIKSGERINCWSFDYSDAKYLLKNSWPLVLSSIVVSIYMKVDQVMLGNMLGNEPVGQYAAAVRLSEVWYFIPVVIASSLFPSIINAQKTSRKLYLQRLQHLNDLMVILALTIAIPTTFLGHWVVSVLYGNAYGQSANVLIIHIWASLFMFMSVASGKFLTADNQVTKIFYRNVAGLLINLTLNYMLIPTYGIEGAAVATLISALTAGFLYDIADKELNYMFKIKCNSFNVFRLVQFWKS